MPSLWSRIREWAFRMAALFAEVAIGVPGIIIAFENDLDNRWLVLVLTVIFLLISVVFASFRGRHRAGAVTLYLMVETALTVVLLVLNPFMTFYVIWFYVLSIEAIMAFDRRTGLTWLLGFTLLTVVLLLSLLPFLEAMVNLPIFLGGFFFFVTFANASYQANEARKESQRLLAELQVAHRQLQEYALKAEQLAVSEERNRLSREMHDTLGHRLTVASVQLEGLQKLISRDPAKAEEMAAVVREQVRAALAELRQTVATLREPLETDLPLITSLEKLTDDFESATGLQVHRLFPETLPELAPEQRLALYRTAQEALTNVQKHAAASQVWVQLEHSDGNLVLRVSDNGKGLENEGDDRTGFGLRGMQERATILGAELRVEARQGGGTQVSLRLPVGNNL